MRNGDYDQAIRLIKEAQSTRPGNAALQKALERVNAAWLDASAAALVEGADCLSRNDFAAAINALEKVAPLNPNYEQRAQVQLRKAKIGYAKTLLRRAKELYADKSYISAKSLLEEVLDNQPDLQAAKELLAKIGPLAAQERARNEKRESSPASSSSSTSTLASTGRWPYVQALVRASGGWLVITTTVHNDSYTKLEGKLAVYIVDSIGGRHHVDTYTLRIPPYEAASAKAAKRISEINGPPPYDVDYTWN